MYLNMITFNKEMEVHVYHPQIFFPAYIAHLCVCIYVHRALLNLINH